MRRHITVSEIADAANDALVGSIYVSEPASVVSYDPVAQTCSAQPLLADVRFDTVTGQPFAENWPVLQNIPVMWPRGGGACLAFGLAPNDTVNLVAWDFSVTGVVTQPGIAPQMPTDIRKLAGHAWRAIPEALFKLPPPEAAAAMKGGVIGLIGGVQLRFVGSPSPGPAVPQTAGMAQVGLQAGLDASLAQPVALAGGATGIDAFVATLYTLFTSGWTPVAGDGGAALKAAFTAAFPAPPASTGAKTLGAM